MTCKYCASSFHTGPYDCPRVKRIEHDVDGNVSAIEFHPPQAAYFEVSRANEDGEFTVSGSDFDKITAYVRKRDMQ